MHQELLDWFDVNQEVMWTKLQATRGKAKRAKEELSNVADETDAVRLEVYQISEQAGEDYVNFVQAYGQFQALFDRCKEEEGNGLVGVYQEVIKFSVNWELEKPMGKFSTTE